MFKGTTPTHTFEVNIDTSLIKEVKIIYCQRDREILVKRTDECTLGDNEISTKLSQEDTFLFDDNTFATVQLRVLTIDEEALITDPIMVSVGKCLDEEVLK